ncbi:MAG TPA: hypothetical protein VN408_15895 [Actinoplanes sp.]|nr:hypothetical protein [Actinoplanes sp.]
MDADSVHCAKPRVLTALSLTVVMVATGAWALVAGNAGAAPGDPPPSAADLRVAYAGTQHRSIGVAALTGPATTPLFGTGPQHFDDEASARGGTVTWVSRRATRLAQVFTRSEAGTVRRIITPETESASRPVISADGSRVAFALTREGAGGPRDIWMANTDGTGAAVRVTDGTGDNYWPTWSADGTEIAFEGRRGSGVPMIWCIRVGDQNSALLVTDGAGTGAGEPAWNNGPGRDATIAYTRNPTDPAARRVRLANRDGTNDRALLDEPWESRQPSWSTDGATLVFLSRSVQPNGQIPADGIDRVYTAVPRDDACTCTAVLHSAEDRLVSHPGWYTPPGGTEGLIVTRTSAPDRLTVTLQDIRPDAVDPRDLGVTLLREDPGADTNPELLWNPVAGDPWWSRPSYSPDGQQILISRFEPEGTARMARLWVVNADGSAPRRLELAGRTPTAHETEAVWSPDGTRIAYSRREAGLPARIVVAEVATGAEVRTLPVAAAGAGDTEPAWSADSRELAYTRGQRFGAGAGSHVWVVPADPASTVLPRNISEASGCQCRNDYSAAFSPDNQRIAFGRSPDGLLVTDVRGEGCDVLVPAGRACGDDLTAPADGPHRPAEIDWAPDNHRLAHVSRRFDPAASPEYVKTFDLDDDFRDGLTWEIPGRHKWPVWQRASDVATAVVLEPGTVPAGETATVEFSVTDKGPVQAYGIRVDLVVPAGARLTGLDAADPTTSCDVVRRSCVLGAIGIGGTRVIRAQLIAAAPLRSELEWTARGYLADAVPGDNTGRVTLDFEGAPTTPPSSGPPSPPPTPVPPVTTPDVLVSVVVDPTPTWVGHRTTVTYTIRNVGDGTATNVVIRPRLPGGIPVITRPVVCGVTCALGDLPPDAVRTLTFVLVPPRPVDTTARGTVTADTVPARNVSTPLRVLQPRIVAIPAMGPPGFVTIIRGRDFPPGARVRLAWDTGVTVTTNPAVPGDDGRFDAQLQVLPRDELGPREVLGSGAGFTRVTTDFRVVLPAQQPPGLVLRR